MQNIIPAFLLWVAPISGDGASIRGTMVRVIDGDTLVIRTEDSVLHRIRLQDIDAPELSQPFGADSRRALTQKIGSKPLSVDVRGIDRYGRQVGEVKVGRRNINLWLVQHGFAHAWNQCRDDRLHEAERVAKERHLGLWSEAPSPERPWDYRQRQ